MKKGEELKVLFPRQDRRQWCRLRVTGSSKNGTHVEWLSGPLAGKPALIETTMLREMRDAK